MEWMEKRFNLDKIMMLATNGHVLVYLTLQVFYNMLELLVLEEYFSFEKVRGFYHNYFEIIELINSLKNDPIINPKIKSHYENGKLERK